MAILNLLGAKAHLNASHAGAHYRCSPRTPFLAVTGTFPSTPLYVQVTNGKLGPRITSEWSIRPEPDDGPVSVPDQQSGLKRPADSLSNAVLSVITHK